MYDIYETLLFNPNFSTTEQEFEKGEESAQPGSDSQCRIKQTRLCLPPDYNPNIIQQKKLLRLISMNK